MCSQKLYNTQGPVLIFGVFSFALFAWNVNGVVLLDNNICGLIFHFKRQIRDERIQVVLVSLCTRRACLFLALHGQMCKRIVEISSLLYVISILIDVRR